MTAKRGQVYSFTEQVRNRPARLAIYFIGQYDATLCVINRNSGRSFDNDVTETTISHRECIYPMNPDAPRIKLIKSLLWHSLGLERRCSWFSNK